MNINSIQFTIELTLNLELTLKNREKFVPNFQFDFKSGFTFVVVDAHLMLLLLFQR